MGKNILDRADSFLAFGDGNEKIIKAGLILAAFAAIGLVRLWTAVFFGIDLNGKWYSFDPDVVFIMAVYPIYLCFFLFMCTDLLLGRLGEKHDRRKLLALFVLLQLLHLIIPFVELFAEATKIPFLFEPYMNVGGTDPNPFCLASGPLDFAIVLTPLIFIFTHPVMITPGIVAAWAISGIALFRFLVSQGIRAGKAGLVVFAMAHVAYWPIYKYFFVADGLFNAIAGIEAYNHFGYGLFFLGFGLLGMAYAFCGGGRRKRKSKA
jgi:hypothetical protein